MYEGTVTSSGRHDVGAGQRRRHPAAERKRGGSGSSLRCSSPRRPRRRRLLLHAQAGAPSARRSGATTAAAARRGRRGDEAQGLRSRSRRKPEGCAIWINGDLRKQVDAGEDREAPLRRASSSSSSRRRASRPTARRSRSRTKRRTKTIDGRDEGRLGHGGAQGRPAADHLARRQAVEGRPRTRSRASPPARSTRSCSAGNGYVAEDRHVHREAGRDEDDHGALVKGDPDAASRRAKARRAERRPAAAGGSGKVRVGAKGGFCNVTINGAGLRPDARRGDRQRRHRARLVQARRRRRVAIDGRAGEGGRDRAGRVQALGEGRCPFTPRGLRPSTPQGAVPLDPSVASPSATQAPSQQHSSLATLGVSPPAASRCFGSPFGRHQNRVWGHCPQWGEGATPLLSYSVVLARRR